ncbi:hypothetical protein V8C35DRAFT_318654 [Trichoderma chlorosporum]
MSGIVPICLQRASCIHPRELSMVEDQLARLSTWATGNGVFAPNRASMDHRLRYAPEVQSVAMGLLESVDYRIGQCSEIFSVYDKDQKANDLSPLDESLRRSLGDLAAEISHLYKMSNMIRRASKELHILKAKDFQIKDEDGNDVEPLLLNHYKRYIGDRFPTISHAIQARLAETMVLRRKRILYRRFRHGNTAIKLKQAAPQVSVTLPGAQVSAEQVNIQQQGNEDTEEAAPVNAPSHVKSATTLQPEKFKLAKSSPSVVSTSMTVALGNHETLNFPTAPGIRAKRKYERLVKERLEAYSAVFNTSDELSPGEYSTSPSIIDERDTQLSAEQHLKEALKSDLEAIGEITCPYCLYTLSAEEVFNEKKWQNHVKIDLDPYVCLAEDCNQTDELYKHSETWINHMQQHSQRWRCPSHRELGLFTTCEDYMQHMREDHKTSLNESKLRILANRNVRNTPKLFMSCPLCGKDEAEVGGRLEDHITGHLRSLALKSLPSQEDETQTDEESEHNSSGGSQSRSRTTVKNLSDDGRINLLETNNDERRLAETEDTNFLGDTHINLDRNATNMWTSWVNDWTFDTYGPAGSSESADVQISDLDYDRMGGNFRDEKKPPRDNDRDATRDRPTRAFDAFARDNKEAENDARARNGAGREQRVERFQTWIEPMKKGKIGGDKRPAAAATAPEPVAEVERIQSPPQPSVIEAAPDKFFLAFGDFQKQTIRKSSRFTSFFHQPQEEAQGRVEQSTSVPPAVSQFSPGLGPVPGMGHPTEEEKQAFRQLLLKIQKQSLSPTPPAHSPFAPPPHG